jgi:hypothetical protein
VDPVRDLTVQFMTQVRRRSSFSVYPDLKRWVHEAVIQQPLRQGPLT